MDFIEKHLPSPRARVLDAGCGSGALADRLRDKGHDVTAIDIDPAHGSPTVTVADICSYEDEPFDAVVFSLSLHHVHSLDKAVERAFALLKPGGRLVVDEFVHERADTAIADRFYGQPGSLARWREHHRELHTGEAMIDAINRRFTVSSLTSVPYLFRYMEDDSLRASESVLGLQLTAVRKEPIMAIVRTTRFTIASADVEEMLARRAALITRIRADHPGLTETRLSRLEDGTYSDAWRYADLDQMQAVLATAPSLPEAAAAFAIAADLTAENAEIVDER